MQRTQQIGDELGGPIRDLRWLSDQAARLRRCQRYSRLCCDNDNKVFAVLRKSEDLFNLPAPLLINTGAAGNTQWAGNYFTYADSIFMAASDNNARHSAATGAAHCL